MKVRCTAFWLVLMVTVGGTAPLVQAADETKSADYSMEEVVVTATKLPQAEKDITQKVDVISAEEMEQRVLGRRNLSEIFIYQPGTFVNPLSRNDANWGSYGGLGPKYSGYLLDGLPIDSFVDPMSLDILALERAEVQRGPASVMYGNYLSMDFAGNQTPLAGTTNLILKEKITQPATRFLAGYGSYDTLTARAYHQNSKGPVDFFVGANYEQSDYTDYGTKDSWLNMVDDPEYRKTKLYAKGTWFIDPDSQKLSFFVHHTQHTGDVGRPNRDFSHIYDTLNAAYFNQLTPEFSVQLKGGYRYYNRQWEEDNFPDLSLREEDGVKQHIVPADLSFNFKHLDTGLLTFGTSYQYALYKTYAEVDGDQSTGNNMGAEAIGLFAEEKFGFGPLVLRLGGRYDYTRHDYTRIGGAEPEKDEKTWDKFLWSTGVKYNLTQEAALYGNVGTSYLVPSGKQVGGTLKSTDRGVPGRNGQLPNPNLQPESGIGYDLGAEYASGRLRAGVRGFYTQVDDAIVENRVSDNPSQSQSVNAGEARSYGVETELRCRFHEMVAAFANLTLTHTEVDNNVDRDQDGSDVPFVPNYIANVGLTLNLPWDITLSPYLTAVGHYYDSTSTSGRNKFGPYEVMNLHAEKILVKNPNFQVNFLLDLYNLFDKDYEMPWQFQDPGFQAFASIEVIF